MKKYLITGYNGFVSKHFLEFLESLHEAVVVLGVDVNPSSFLPDYTYVHCNFIQLDLLNKEAISTMLKDFQPDFILHLASYSSVAYSWQFPVNAFANNTNIFLNLVDEVRLQNLKCRILSVGSSEEYGNISENQIPVTERTPVKPKSPYAVARVSQEMLSEVYAKNFDTDIVLTRSFNHIGPGQKDIFVISSFARKMVDLKNSAHPDKEINVGNISLIRDFVDVRDVVRAYYFLLHKGVKGEVYNVCSGTGNSLEFILNVMSEILELKLSVVTDHNLMRPDDIKKMIGSNEKIFSHTGWKPEISLRASLSDIIEYWKQQIHRN